MAATEVMTCLREIVGKMHAAGVQARECHWNVTGMSFGPLHALFGEAYAELSDIEDILAERVRALRGKMPVTCINEMFPVQSIAGATASTMISTVLKTYGMLCECLCAAIKAYETTDPVTTNILQDIVARLDKRAWMLRAHLN